jgi:hypothetical protein
MDMELVLAGVKPKRIRVRVVGTTVEQTTFGKAPKVATKSYADVSTARREGGKVLRAKFRAGYAYLAPDASPGQIIHQSFGPGGGGGAVMDLSLDGRHIACASITSESHFGAKLFVVDVDTGARRIVHECPAGTHQHFVHRLLFDRTGSKLVVCMRFETFLLDLASGATTHLASISGSNPHVAKPAFDRSRRRLVVFDEHRVRVLDADALAPLETVDPTTGEVRNEPASLLDVPTADAPECRYASLSSSGRRLALSFDIGDRSRVQVYDVDTGLLRTTLEVPKLDMVMPLDDDETLLASPYYHQGPVALDLATGERRWQFDGHDGRLDRAHDWALSADDTRLAVARVHPALYKWPSREPIELADPDDIYGAACISFSADGTRLAASCNGLNVVYRTI